jgi:hypothetical protein
MTTFCCKPLLQSRIIFSVVIAEAASSSVAEPHHFYAAPAPGKIFDAAPAAPAPAPTHCIARQNF